MIVFDNVTKIFENGSLALKDINIKINQGDYLYVTGKSGAGKSTFLRLLTRELIPERGTIENGNWKLEMLKDKEVVAYRRELGIIFQDFKLIDSMNIFDNISYRLEIIGIDSKMIRKEVARMLSIVGLESKSSCMPKELSGGEQQRIAIARACVVRPKLLVADEPTANLDYKNAIKVIELFKTMQKTGTTVIVATHDEDIRKYFPADCLKIQENMIFRVGKDSV